MDKYIRKIFVATYYEREKHSKKDPSLRREICVAAKFIAEKRDGEPRRSP